MSRYEEDRPGAVRAGETLDGERLTAYLRTLFQGVGAVRIAQFRRGFSNLTYGISLDLPEGQRELVLRRPPFGPRAPSAHDMEREHRILSRLAEVYRKAPRPLVYCDDESVLGAPFYLMERVHGIILRGDAVAGGAPPSHVMGDVARAFVDALVELHSLDYAGAGLGDLGRPEGYRRRQVEGWLGRYERARTDDVPELERAGRWLASELAGDAGSVPDASSSALVHNDFKYDNVVLDAEDPSRVVAILDWEMATIGDPLLDLGTTLAYWVDPEDPAPLRALALTPTTLPGNPRRARVAELYAERRPFDERRLVFAYVFGLFKIAVIVQQIYARYRSGHTRDPRFADLIDAVRALGWAAARSIELDRIDQLDG